MKLTWRTLPASGLPSWLSALGGKSGVYLIRRAGVVVYVGESHSGRLKKTLAHHFQSWTGRTAGATYPRSGSEVAVIVLPPSAAVAKQNALIRELRPRDNVAGKPSRRRVPSKAPAQTFGAALAEVFDALNPF